MRPNRWDSPEGLWAALAALIALLTAGIVLVGTSVPDDDPEPFPPTVYLHPSPPTRIGE